MASTGPIPLRVSNKKAYVWDVDGETKEPLSRSFVRLTFIRHRYTAFTSRLRRLDWNAPPSITAKCFLGLATFAHARGGCSPRRQGSVGSYIGVPIATHFVTTFFHTGLAILVDDPSAHHDPSSAQLARWDSERLRGIEEQVALAEEYEARKALNPDRAMSDEAILKRKEREEKRARGNVNSLEPNESLSTPVTTERIPEPTESSRITRSHRSDVIAVRHPTTPYTAHVPGSSSTFEWYAPLTHSFTTVEAARGAGLWDYPETPNQRARCAVFRDLWEQGYFMGSGIKFGGEYLVYPGTSFWFKPSKLLFVMLDLPRLSCYHTCLRSDHQCYSRL